MAQSSSTGGGTSNRKHLKEQNVNLSNSSRYADSDWETRETMLFRELEETKARAAQMEKTMRWWSDCTANWREKWSEVKDERNKMKKEAKILKSKIDSLKKDVNVVKQDSHDLMTQNKILKKEFIRIHGILKNSDQFDPSCLEVDSLLKSILENEESLEVCSNGENSGNITPSSLKKDGDSCRSPRSSTDGGDSADKDIEEYILQGAVPKRVLDSPKENSLTDSEKRLLRLSSASEEALMHKMSMLNLRLDEAAKTINVEREEKNNLHQNIEKLRNEIVQLKVKCKELQQSRTEASKELLELKGRFQGELNAAQADLIDEATNREGMDRRLSELRSELEKLQAENAAEWGKRERLETEKISLERENKQLRSEVRELQERCESRRPTRPVSGCFEALDAKQLQHELLERNREMQDLKHAQAKLKKLLAEKTTELSHSIRRSEQYEAEVKRIRARVEELKKELALSQDDIDAANDSARKLQRVNEELTEQLETATQQIDHYRSSIPESRAPDVVTDIDDEKARGDDDDSDIHNDGN